MKIALINASPKKVHPSASGAILKILESYPGNAEAVNFKWNNNSVPAEELEQIADCDAAVIAFPLYVDCLPSHLLRCLKQLEEYLNSREEKRLTRFAVIVNNGFFEGEQNSPAIEVMRNWCARAGVDFIGGLGVGGGGMLTGTLEQVGANGPFKIICDKLQELSGKLLDKNYCGGEIGAVRPACPAFLYTMGAQMGWRSMAKKNGLRVKDLWRQ